MRRQCERELSFASLPQFTFRMALNYSLHLSLTRITIENGCFFVTHKYSHYVCSKRAFSFQRAVRSATQWCEYVVGFSRRFHCSHWLNVKHVICQILPFVYAIFFFSSHLIYDQDRNYLIVHSHSLSELQLKRALERERSRT